MKLKIQIQLAPKPGKITAKKPPLDWRKVSLFILILISPILLWTGVTSLDNGPVESPEQASFNPDNFVAVANPVDETAQIAVPEGASSIEENSEPTSQDSEPNSQDSEPTSQDSEPNSQDSEPNSQDSEPNSQDSEPNSQDSESNNLNSESSSQDSEPKSQDLARKTMVAKPGIKTQEAVALENIKRVVQPPAMPSDNTFIQEPEVKNTPAQEPAVANAELTLARATTQISRTVLTTGINNREPVDQLATKLTGIPLNKIYLFNEVNGLSGHYINHRWLLNGSEVAKVRLPIGSQRWRTYSSKIITLEMTGHWQIEVSDHQGKLLTVHNFDYYH